MIVLAETFKRPSKVTKPRGYWADIENRKKLFIDIAARLGFDPFQPENWRKVKSQTVKEMVPIYQLTQYYVPN